MRRRHGWDRMGGCSIATMDLHLTHTNPFTLLATSVAEPTLNDHNFSERAFTVGIGGPLATGKTALMLALCRILRDKYSLAVVKNDIFTKEDGKFLADYIIYIIDVSAGDKIPRKGGPGITQADLLIEMMSEAIDETLDKDGAEEETEDLTNQVLDEIGIGVASQVKNIIYTYGKAISFFRFLSSESSEVDELEKRLASLRRN